MPDMIRLRYVGGDRYIIGVPACDHDAPVDEACDLVVTGLYEIEPEPSTPEVVDDVDEEGRN